MAQEEGDFGGGGEGLDGAPKRKLPPLQILLVLVNTLLLLGALGTMVYTKLLYQRPLITETVELEKRVEEIKKPVTPAEHVLVNFDEMTVNIAMTSGRSHFAKIAFSLDCRDAECATAVNLRKAQLLDIIIAALGRRQMRELNTIQGKLLLKTELMRKFNEQLPSGGVLDIYFGSFILQ